MTTLTLKASVVGLVALLAGGGAGCVSGAGDRSSPSLGSAPVSSAAGGGEIDQVPATKGAMPLTLSDSDLNANQGAEGRGGFAVTSLGGQVYLPRQALANLWGRVPAAEKALASNPGSLAALKILGYKALSAGANGQALAYMKIAAEKGGLDDEALNIVGVAHFFEGRDDMAMESFLQASRMNSRNALPNLNMGLLKQKRGNSLESLIYFKRAIAADSKSALGYLHAANAAYTAKQYKTAAEFLRRAIDVAPQNALAYYNLGVVYHYGLREYAKAKSNFRTVIDSREVSTGLRDLARGMLANVQREET